MERFMQLKEALSLIREIPDFPIPGILFKDITPLLANPQALTLTTDALLGDQNSYSHIVGVEARGFILGSAMAIRSGKGFIPFRKAGKLPHMTISKSYGLEYGSDTLEAHADAAKSGDRLLLVDDVLATGGTIIAAIEIVKELGAEISEIVVLLEIQSLGGRAKIAQRFPEINIRTLLVD
jgi:adenine phosphoribosyltransferase